MGMMGEAAQAKSGLLAETRLLDFSATTIQALIDRQSWRGLPPEAAAAGIYTFVRDEILFGYNSDDALPASQILSDGYGQCNTKATLFMALLRAVGIPCRFHGFTIHKALQRGAVTGIFYHLAPNDILHSWVEVWLNGRWINLEGLILDRPYLRQLQHRFKDSSRNFCGYGAATANLCMPEVEWTGGDTYIQRDGINRDFGLYDTLDAFYAEVGTNVTGWRRWLYVHFVRHLMNSNVARIRNAVI